MLDQMLAFFELRPHFHLAVMEADQDLFGLTCRLLQALQPVLATEHPDVILVQGDTTTSFVAALAGYYLHIPTGHIEAGLRSGDPYNPFPEEINRRMTSHLARWHFAPTPRARENLLREGVSAERIVVTGNTIVDAIHEILVRLGGEVEEATPRIDDFIAGRRLILMTGHRRESFGEGLHNICTALRMIAERNDDVAILYPVHLNPHVQLPVNQILGSHPRIRLTEPLDYLSFVRWMRKAYLIITDSGGIQEEAPSLGIPVLVVRETTERPEGVEAGVSRLVGTRTERIVTEAERLLHDASAYRSMVAAENPYGDGHAAEAIVRHLEQVLEDDI
jgi:UDP-N-acetylglucosamine 2-epimerase (non-hydrolysing)